MAAPKQIELTWLSKRQSGDEVLLTPQKIRTKRGPGMPNLLPNLVPNPQRFRNALMKALKESLRRHRKATVSGRYVMLYEHSNGSQRLQGCYFTYNYPPLKIKTNLGWVAESWLEDAEQHIQHGPFAEKVPKGWTLSGYACMRIETHAMA